MSCNGVRFGSGFDTVGVFAGTAAAGVSGGADAGGGGGAEPVGPGGTLRAGVCGTCSTVGAGPVCHTTASATTTTTTMPATIAMTYRRSTVTSTTARRPQRLSRQDFSDSSAPKTPHQINGFQFNAGRAPALQEGSQDRPGASDKVHTAAHEEET